jgi:predicted nucleic acid-binding protein
MDGVAKLYVDANILIYFVEGTAELREIVARVFADADARGAVLVTSEISIVECLHGPFKTGNKRLVETWRALFRDEQLIAIAPVLGPVLDVAAQVGAEFALKTIDAIHVASAMSAGCDALLTNDKGMRAPKRLAIRQLAQWR